jgi:hypothetical protein
MTICAVLLRLMLLLVICVVVVLVFVSLAFRIVVVPVREVVVPVGERSDVSGVSDVVRSEELVSPDVRLPKAEVVDAGLENFNDEEAVGVREDAIASCSKIIPAAYAMETSLMTCAPNSTPQELHPDAKLAASCCSDFALFCPIQPFQA